MTESEQRQIESDLYHATANLDIATARIEELEQLINSPELDDFLKGVGLESAHQTERWGAESEARKSPEHYALVLNKLQGKQAVAIFDQNTEKYKHHLITMAGVCFNVHRQIEQHGTSVHMRFIKAS